MSCVHALESGVQLTLPETGTHADPLHVWHSRHEVETQAPAEEHTYPLEQVPQVKQLEGDDPQALPPQSLAIRG